MGRSNFSTNELLNAVTKRSYNRYQTQTVDYQHLEAATTTSGLVSNRREYSSALLLADKFSLNPLNLAQANYDPFLKSILSTDWEDTLKELSGESGFNAGLDISLTNDGTKLAVITRDKETIYLNEGNTEIKVYSYDSTRYDLASPENVATHTYQSVSYTISGIDSTDDGHQVVAVLNDQALQKFSLSETNVLTSDTRFSFGPLGGTGDLTVNLSHDGKRVFVFQPGAPARVYEYANLQGGYYTMSTSNIQKGIMSKNGDRFIIKTSQGIETFDVPKQAPNGAVVLERIPATLTYTGVIIGGTPLALSFDGSLMLGLENGNVKLYVWSGVMWKEYVTVVSGSFFSVADISRDGTYVIVGGSGAPVKTFKWDPSTETYNEYGGTTLYAVNNADSTSINQNGDKAVIGTNTNTSQIYTLADGTWNRRTTVSGTSGEGKVGCVRVANDGRAFATASDSRITFFGDFTNKQYPVGWTQRGNTVSIPSYVKSIALSDDGNYLIAGLYKETTTFLVGIQANAGKVRVYGLSGSTWSQRGADIEYDTANTFFGSAVAISPDGSKFAAGGNGIVRVFKNEIGTNPTNLKNTISSIALTPQSSLLEMNADGSRLVVNRTIFDNAVAKGGVDSADALNLSNDGNHLAVEANNTAFLYGINSQGVVSLVGTNILPTDSTAHVGNYRTNTANANTKINVNAANSQLLNLASSYGTTTEICSLTYDPTTETTQRTTTNRILTTESSEITGFASHDGIVISRDGGTLAVYDNTKFSIYNYTNSAWTFVRTKTVTSGPYLVVLSHDGSRVAYRDGSLKVENTLTGASLGSISVASLYTYAFKSNTTLALLQGTNDIELYDYDGTNWSLGETISYSGTNSSTSLLWSGDGTRLAAGDSGSNRRVAFFEYDSTLTAPVFSFVQEGSAHTASLQALSGTGDVKVLGTSTGVEIHEASGTATFTGGAATSIDVSIDGTRVVVGTSSKMYVVHKSAGVWTQLGSDIAGNAPRVAISRDGSKIFSHDLVLKSYEYVSGSWTTYLPDLTASGATSKVSSSTDGDIVAVGTNVYSKQSVTTTAGYTFNASGSTFSGTEQAVSGNGNVRVVADKSVNSSTGQALIYEKVGGSWSSTASATFTGASATEEFGRDVDVSNDGTRVVIGSGTKMVVVEKSGGSWSQLGSDIAGSTTKVAISRDGSKVFAYSGSDMKSYEYVSGSWTQYLPDLTGLSSITRLAPSTDGDIVALSKNNANQVYSKQSVTTSAGYTISQPVATFQEPGGSVISNNGLVAVTYDNSSIGEVNIFEKDSGGNWPSTASATYTGSSTGEYFGRVLGVSDDGTRVAMQSSSKMMVVDKSATTTTYTVTVASVGGGNRYHIDGIDRASLTFYRGNTYVFDLSDASNNGHPLVFSPTTTGVVDNYSTNLPGTTGSQVTFTVPANAPSSMSYLCQTHGSGMGSTITVSDRVWTQIGSDITASFNAMTGSCMSGDGTKVFGSSAVQGGGTSISQVGSDIYGLAGDYVGSVAMSSDGQRMVIGAQLHSSNLGTARVYDWNSGTSQWTQLGPDIDGENANDRFAYVVSMSSDGTRVAIGTPFNDDGGTNAGHVRVYDWNSGTSLWDKVGSDIDGEAAGDYSGYAISLSGDGSRLAIGAYKNKGVTGTLTQAGHTRVFVWSSGSWSQVGSDIDGPGNRYDSSGWSVSLSSDGTRLAVGSTLHDSNGDNNGLVRVYSESSGNWNQIGLDLAGEDAQDQFGSSVSLSSDGTRVAVGAAYNKPLGVNPRGAAYVYSESGGSWTQMGSDIHGEADYDRFGFAISLSSDGTRVAIGAFLNKGGLTGFDDYGDEYEDAGHVRVYDWDATSSQWTQLGSDFDGEAASDYYGQHVSISGDGTRVAISSMYNDGGGNNSGQVQVYSFVPPATQYASSWEYSGSSWSQYRPDITVSNTISRISHSTNGEILGLEDATRTYIYATTGSASTYTKRHADAFYSTQNHSMTDDGANVISGDFSGSRVWNGTNYVYDGASGTNAPWGRLTSPDLVEVSGNGNLVFRVDNDANNLRIYSKSTVNGNVQWTLSTSLAYTYSPVKMSALGSDAIIVTGSGSAGAKIYDITYTAGGTTDQYATRGSVISGNMIDMSDDGSTVVGWISSGSMTWNGSTDYAYDGSGGTQVPWYGSMISPYDDWEMAHNIRISGDGTRVVAVSSFSGGGGETFLRMWFKSGSSWADTGVTMLEINGVTGVEDVSLNTDGTFFGIDESTQVKFFDVIYNAGSTTDQYVIRGSGLGSGSNHDLSDDGDYVVYTNVSPGTKAWNGSSWAYNGPAASSGAWSSNHTVLALSGDATKAIAFKSTTNEVILYTKDAQHEWSENVTLTQTGVTALSIDTDGSIVGVVANSQTKFYTFGSTQSPIGWVSHSSFQDTAEPGFAQAFDISNDGDAVVVGVSGDGTSSYRGAVRVYDYTSSWALRSTITPPSETAANGNVGYRNFGKSVSVSSDGTKIAYLGDQGTYSGSADWTQLGSDIDGEATSDQSGFSVSMSSDGTRVAIGAPYNDGNGSNAGHVRVYSESGGAWTQVGADIDGEAYNDDYSGTSVSMSSDGTRVAIGATGNDGNGNGAGHVRVYAESGGTWTQVGADIDGEAAGDQSGRSVSMSSDGTRVAIGANANDGTDSYAGHVRVYAESGGTWTQVGADIDGEAVYNQSGWSVSMSSDGTRMAIGALYNGGTGHVRVYSESGGTWTQVGSDIDGEAANDQSGRSVSMSSDGTRVAIGAPYNDGNGSNAGHVRVYAESGGAWTQVGDDIDGEAAGDNSGYSVSMSSDGTRVAIGAYGNGATGSYAGHVRVYAESGGTWTQAGADIDGEAAGDWSGRSVSISPDGTRVAIGAIFNDDNGNNSGHVRVYYFLPQTMNPNRSEASTRDWQNSAWVNPAYASDEVTLTEVVPVSEDRDLETVSMSYDGTRFGVRASSGSYDAIVKKVDTLVITTTDILGWTKRGDIISFDTTDSVAATTSRSMRSSVDGNTVAFGYVNSSGVKIRVYGFASGSWSQLGSEISTTGTTISMDVSSDGTRVAVLSGDTGRVFAYGGGSWSQFGSSIAFRPTGVNTIKISGNGNYVALGNNTPSDPYPFNILRVYKKNVDWELISPTMTLTKTPSNFFGAGFGLLNDGSRLVHYTDSGVEFASFITTTGTDFTQHSTDITGNGVGSNLAFDNSGSTLVTSSFTDNVIRVYDSSHNQVTTFDVKIMYADIEQPFGSPDAMETKPFAITKDGTKIVTVAPPGVSGLRAIVYKKQNGIWSQEGNTIEIAVTDRISSVDITNDGNTVIVGSIDEAAYGANPCPGRAQAFTLSNGTWSQLGGTITNPEGNHRFSNVVAISDIGTIVAAGHYTYNGGRPFGVVKTYESKDEIQDISFGPPIIELIGNSYIRLPLNAIYTELGATITTQASTSPEIKITGTVKTGIPGVYTIRYECEDSLRKKATPIFRQVEIISAVPTFRIKGEPIVYHTKDILYTDQGIEVFSGYEDGTDFEMFYITPGSPFSPILVSNSAFTPTQEGDYTIVWVDQLIDEHLRTGSLHTRVVRVRERPIITLTGASVIYHRLFDPFVDPGVTITQSSYGFEGTTTATAINPNLSGVYTITYTAVDKFGIEAVTVTRTVDVRERPSITAAQTSFYNILNDPISVPTPTVSPSNLASLLQSSNNIDINARGDYTITHTLTDSVGISAQPFTQQFSVGTHGTLTFSDTGTVFALSKNGGDLAVFDTTLKTYKVQGFAQYGDVATPAPPTSIKFTPDGQYMVVGMASHLTIGVARVYKKNVTFSSGWEQVGFDLFGTDYLGKFGESVDINADATRIVVGAPEAGTAILKSGSVKIYDWTGFFWKQSSFVVEGTIPSQLMGFSVSLDNEGTTLAVGSPGHTTTTVSGTTITTANVGKVSVYKLSGSDWQLSGSEIEDGTEGKRNGTSVSLSRSGNVLAVGSVLGGGVRVYRYSTDWTLYGSHVQGSFGESVSLSSNGNTLVAGSKDENKGRVYKYTFGGDGWSRSTDTFDTIVAGEGSTTFLGKKVSLDGSGELLCVSSNTDVRIYLV